MNHHAALPMTPGPLSPDPDTWHFTPLLQPDLADLYARRAARLRALADGHELADYLRLAARVA